MLIQITELVSGTVGSTFVAVVLLGVILITGYKFLDYFGDLPSV